MLLNLRRRRGRGKGRGRGEEEGEGEEEEGPDGRREGKRREVREGDNEEEGRTICRVTVVFSAIKWLSIFGLQTSHAVLYTRVCIKGCLPTPSGKKKSFSKGHTSLVYTVEDLCKLCKHSTCQLHRVAQPSRLLLSGLDV